MCWNSSLTNLGILMFSTHRYCCVILSIVFCCSCLFACCWQQQRGTGASPRVTYCESVVLESFYSHRRKATSFGVSYKYFQSVITVLDHSTTIILFGAREASLIGRNKDSLRSE